MNNTSHKERCVMMATYLIENNSTVRKVGAHFGLGKSTVHKDITENLEQIDKELHQKVKTILEINKKERHIRGGEATKARYLQCKNEKI